MGGTKWEGAERDRAGFGPREAGKMGSVVGGYGRADTSGAGRNIITLQPYALLRGPKLDAATRIPMKSHTASTYLLCSCCPLHAKPCNCTKKSTQRTHAIAEDYA